MPTDDALPSAVRCDSAPDRARAAVGWLNQPTVGGVDEARRALAGLQHVVSEGTRSLSGPWRLVGWATPLIAQQWL